MTDEQLTVVASFLNKIDAEIARGALEADDIDAIVSADDAGGVRPGLWMGGVRVLVRARDAKRAAEILNQPR